MGTEDRVTVEVSGWLRVYSDGSVDRSWTGPPDVEFLLTPVPPSNEFVDGVATPDVVIDPHSGLSVRIYVPEPNSDDETKHPVMLHLHRGGFCMSRANWYMYRQFYTLLVKSARAVCVSVDFLLAPEHRLPRAIDDCYADRLWLRSLARAELSEPSFDDRADFGCVFLVGDPTRGNLVRQVAARAASDEWGPLRLAGGVLMHPGFVRAQRSKSELDLRSDPFLTLDMVDKLLGMGLPLGSTNDHPITCPMGPDAPPLAGMKLPPFLVAVAVNDLMRDTELEYVEAMNEIAVDFIVSRTRLPWIGYLDGLVFSTRCDLIFMI